MQVYTRGKDMIPNPHFRKTYASLSTSGRNQRMPSGRFCPPIRGKFFVSTRQSYPSRPSTIRRWYERQDLQNSMLEGKASTVVE